METVNFLGQECNSLSNEVMRLLVTHSVGPRILSFGFTEGENLFAELPDSVTDCPGHGVFHFYGGHRLWHAPEEPSCTYIPDDSPVDITPLENGLVATQKLESQTGLQKSIQINISNASSQVLIKHQITNHGLWDVTCAPWAITQFKTGGTAVLPQAREDTGVLPNRSLTLWPYTNMSDPHVQWGRDVILIDANMDAPFKVGFPQPTQLAGILAQWNAFCKAREV